MPEDISYAYFEAIRRQLHSANPALVLPPATSMHRSAAMQRLYGPSMALAPTTRGPQAVAIGEVLGSRRQIYRRLFSDTFAAALISIKTNPPPRAHVPFSLEGAFMRKLIPTALWR